MTNPDVPTLVERIDAAIATAAQYMPKDSNLDAIREAAVALETEFAIARADLANKAEEFLLLNQQLATTVADYEAEEKEADKYAREMHASDDVAKYFYERFLASGEKPPIDIPLEIEAKISAILIRTQRKGNKGGGAVAPIAATVRKMITTAEVAPLVTLEG